MVMVRAGVAIPIFLGIVDAFAAMTITLVGRARVSARILFSVVSAVAASAKMVVVRAGVAMPVFLGIIDAGAAMTIRPVGRACIDAHAAVVARRMLLAGSPGVFLRPGIVAVMVVGSEGHTLTRARTSCVVAATKSWLREVVPAPTVGVAAKDPQRLSICAAHASFVVTMDRRVTFVASSASLVVASACGQMRDALFLDACSMYPLAVVGWVLKAMRSLLEATVLLGGTATAPSGVFTATAATRFRRERVGVASGGSPSKARR
mmetsp:Transcript_42487/g.117234  ORF Transcript_42487/g.117234 Transcript_42487/m.117234 type:complete len:263 (-) Transcript_42487:1785-2573(-)